MNYARLTQTLRHKFEDFFKSLSTFQVVIFWIATALLTASAFTLLWYTAQAFTVEAPAIGGTLREGEVGYPHYINPLLSFTSSGKDLSHLIFAGLLRRDQNGNLIPDMAESVTESDDGKTYTAKIKDTAIFHDGQKLTSEDVAFTITRALDVAIKSPEAAKWQGVTVETPDPQTVIFKLKEPFRPFLESLTLGILPKHIWNDLDSDQFNLSVYNLEPIGSGPYKFKSIDRDAESNPIGYHVEAFNKGAAQKPYIQDIIFTFYEDEDDMLAAYKEGLIDSMQGLSSASALRTRSMIEGRGGVLLSLAQPRLFGIFFGQGSNQEALKDIRVRQALSLSVNRKDLIEKSLLGFGHVENGTIPSAFFPALQAKTMALANSSTSSASGTSNNTLSMASTTFSTSGGVDSWYNVEKAEELLLQAGYEKKDGVLFKKGTATKLSLTLSTVSGTELEDAALFIQESWKALGIDVTLQTYESSEISQKVIRNRNFDALLFGLVVPTSLDLYPFWHSSERKDPGANISSYANKDVDALLTQVRRATSSPDTALANIQKAIQTDLPTIFLFSPSYIYVVPSDMQGVYQGGITEPYDRFTNITSSSIETERLWPIFQSYSKKQTQ